MVDQVSRLGKLFLIIFWGGRELGQMYMFAGLLPAPQLRQGESKFLARLTSGQSRKRLPLVARGKPSGAGVATLN